MHRIHRSFAARALRRVLVIAAGMLAAWPSAALAQWSTTYEQYYLPGKFNWQFRNNYPTAERLFNAFDYGHAILYEKLWNSRGNAREELEQKKYDFITRKLLVRPPNVALEEGAIEVAYAKLAPEAKAMFDWAHLLHRQIYDVWSDESLTDAERDAKVQELIRYYKTRRDLAFSSQPKTMELMEGQPYSTAFRKNYPKFNGLIWAYHWLQVGLYEPLMVGKTEAERQAGVRATVARFWQMLEDPPRTFPYQMPMTPAVAPRFAARYPEAAIIFDNLHSMHDVISDILANDAVPRDRKRAEIQLAARRFRDDTSYVMTREGWLAMTRHMGLENMGGPSVGFLPTLPTPTVTYGAVMSHDDRTGEMVGFKYGQATGGEHAAHTAAAPGAATPATDTSHAGHGATPAAPAPGAPAQGAMHGGSDSAHAAHMPRMMELHQRMMADPVIRQRMHADTAMRRMMDAMMADMPAEHRAMMAMPAEGTRVTKEAAPTRAALKPKKT